MNKFSIILAISLTITAGIALGVMVGENDPQVMPLSVRLMMAVLGLVSAFIAAVMFGLVVVTFK